MKQIGDIIELQKQDVNVVACETCGALMVNVKPKEIEKGDFLTLKRLGVVLTNPATKDQVCLNCEIKREETEREEKKKTSSWFSSPHTNDNDDSSYSGGGGGWGGFGGGVFSGGGATGSW